MSSFFDSETNSNFEIEIYDNSEIKKANFNIGNSQSQTINDFYFQMGYYDDSYEWVSLGESNRKSNSTENPLSVIELPKQRSKIGDDIEGENSNDEFGSSVSFNREGTRVAIGGWKNDANGSSSGHVRVFELSNTTWTQMGSDIDGENGGDRSGMSVSLSNDGNILAIGAIYNDGAGSNSGHVRVFQWMNETWTQLGDDIDGESAGDRSGNISLSGNGNIVAVGANNGEKARIHKWNGSNWEQIGATISGNQDSDFGTSISLNNDGTIVAVGGDLNDEGGSNAGYVKIYKWDGSNYTQMGFNIVGESSSDRSGWSVSLNSEGNILAIGGIHNSGHARVYEWRLFTSEDNVSNYNYTDRERNDTKTNPIIITENTTTAPTAGNYYWTQMGDDIDQIMKDDQTGYSISLNNEGNILAVSSPWAFGENGSVRIFEWNNFTWVQIDEPEIDKNGIGIDGENGEKSGYNELGSDGICLNGDGTKLAIGYPKTGNGRVRVYNIIKKKKNSKEIVFKFFGNIGVGEMEELLEESNVNIVDSSGNKYVFNDSKIYNNNKYSMTLGLYTFKNIPIEHPMAILNRDNTDNIKYIVDDKVKIVIKVSGGSTQANTNGDYYTFTDENGSVLNISNGDFRFMRGRTYEFQADGISATHPFNIFHSNTLLGPIEGSNSSIQFKIPLDHSTTEGDIYYICSAHNGMKANLQLLYATVTGTTSDGGYDFYYGNIMVSVSNLFDNISVYCYYHGYMGGENLLIFDKGLVGFVELYESGYDSEYLYSSLDNNTAQTYTISDFYFHDDFYFNNFSGFKEDGKNSNFQITIDSNNEITESRFNSGSTTTNLQTFQDVLYQMGYFDDSYNWVSLTESSKKSSETNSSFPDLNSLTQVSQIGGVIKGETQYNFSGSSVSLSSDGNIIAIGTNTAGIGQVRVYQFKIPSSSEWSNGNVIKDGDTNQVSNKYYWTQLGSDIDGEEIGDLIGHSISLSSDGTVLAIGTPNLNSDLNSGFVKVYQYSNSSWTQLGSKIKGEAIGNEFGYSVSLSSDGNILAIGGTKNYGSDFESGHVRVFKWREYVQADKDNSTYYYLRPEQNSGQLNPIIITEINTQNTTQHLAPVVGDYYWTQLGIDIEGEASGDKSGWSVSLSSDGTIIAIGAVGNDGTASNAGHVRVYQYINSLWTQLGDDINGEASDDQSGLNVSLSSDGTIVAIGAVGNDGTASNAGHVRVYQYNSIWTQLGDDIEGDEAGDQSGWSVSLSSDGNIIAIGSVGSSTGHVRVYQYINSIWTQLGDDIEGDANGDQSGYSISLSNDGTKLAIGANSADVNGTNSGQVKVYNINKSISNIDSKEVVFKFFGNVASGQVIDVTSETIVNVVNSNGNKYLLNNKQTYNQRKFSLKNGSYTFKNIPIEHPMAILNKDDTDNISYLVSTDIITIAVSDGSTTPTNGDYYTFRDENDNEIQIGNGTFRFMRGKDYIFVADGISNSHPFKIYYNGSYSLSISGSGDTIYFQIPINHSTTTGDIYYECANHSNMKGNLHLLNRTVTGTTSDGNYDFFYGDINVNVYGNFGSVSLYCYYHDYMGGENLLLYDKGLIGYSRLFNSDYTSSFTYSDLTEGENTINDFRFVEGFSSMGTYNDYLMKPADGEMKLNCLLEDTLVKTSKGDIKVQDLKRGDIVYNELGHEKIIKSTYSTEIVIDINNKDRDLYGDKYLIRENTVKEGVPSQDLIVSGGHMVKLGNTFHLPIQSPFIKNIQKESGINKYYHIELNNYDFFMANNLPVESLCHEEDEEEKISYFKNREINFTKLINQ